MNLETLNYMTQALDRYGIKACGITIKGKESNTLSLTVFGEDVLAMRKLADDFGFEARMTMDQFLPMDQFRFQLSINEGPY